MEDLKDIRKRITDIDSDMARLFEERMNLVKQVALYKKENCLPIFDSKREKEVLESGIAKIENETIKEYYAEFLQNTMDVSKAYQRSVLGEELLNIHIENGALEYAGKHFALDRKVLVVTDDGVPTQYAEAICKQSKDSYLVVIPQGEESKNLETFEKLCKTMLDNDFSRKDCVVAVGGGVVGDLAGFAAACYMRGIDFYNVPTTLLSQVDSSVGGKTAVDFCGIKNIVGAFHQPKAVLIDPEVLNTLDERQFASGTAEIIKIAMTFDAELFELIERGGIKDRLEEVIERAIKIKFDVVTKDEKELGLRKVLNFGHTLGHGIESVTDMAHGECVAIGMIPMTSNNIRGRLVDVLKRQNLPTNCVAEAEKVISAVMHDKKAENGEVLTVVVDEIGSYRFEKKDKNKLVEAYKEVSL